jgi:hypothetical protein
MHHIGHLTVRNGGNAYPTIAVATAPTGSTFNLAMYTPTGGRPISSGARSATTTGATPATATKAAPVTARQSTT